MQIETYPVPGGRGFRITLDGATLVEQDFDPDLAGSAPMSEARALECAEIIKARLA